MTTAVGSAVTALALVPSGEERLMRETVSGICAGFGPPFIRRCADNDEPPRELWDALGRRSSSSWRG